jgi:hypothetical protein
MKEDAIDTTYRDGRRDRPPTRLHQIAAWMTMTISKTLDRRPHENKITRVDGLTLNSKIVHTRRSERLKATTSSSNPTTAGHSDYYTYEEEHGEEDQPDLWLNAQSAATTSD